VSFPAAILVILLGYLNPDQGLGETIIGGLAGFGFFFFLYVMGAVFNVVMGRLRGSRIDEVAFGFGDVTLAGVIGLTVGWPAVLVALLLGIFIAGAFSLAYILINLLLRKYNPFMPIPYGPFLIAGAFLVYFGGPNILLNLLGR
jgi:prepilin signal peptidase PulO-like enzyme (type II secretory pathway)